MEIIDQNNSLQSFYLHRSANSLEEFYVEHNVENSPRLIDSLSEDDNLQEIPPLNIKKEYIKQENFNPNISENNNEYDQNLKHIDGSQNSSHQNNIVTTDNPSIKSKRLNSINNIIPNLHLIESDDEGAGKKNYESDGCISVMSVKHGRDDSHSIDIDLDEEVDSNSLNKKPAQRSNIFINRAPAKKSYSQMYQSKHHPITNHEFSNNVNGKPNSKKFLNHLKVIEDMDESAISSERSLKNSSRLRTSNLMCNNRNNNMSRSHSNDLNNYNMIDNNSSRNHHEYKLTESVLNNNLHYKYPSLDHLSRYSKSTNSSYSEEESLSNPVHLPRINGKSNNIVASQSQYSKDDNCLSNGVQLEEESADGHMLNYDEPRNEEHTYNYSIYTIQDYKKLPKEIRLGKLGPNIYTPEYRQKLMKLRRQQEYAEAIRRRQQQDASKFAEAQMQPRLHSQPLQPTSAPHKRALALEYAKSIRKPRAASTQCERTRKNDDASSDRRENDDAAADDDADADDDVSDDETYELVELIGELYARHLREKQLVDRTKLNIRI